MSKITKRMKYKSILLFAILAALFASMNFVSCHEYDHENDGYSDWTELTEADSVVFAEARAAYLNDSTNATRPEYVTLKSIESKPSAVRTQVVEKGRYYQFDLAVFVVTIYKGNDDKVGTVIGIEMENDSKPGRPVKRDTIPNI